ncbi:MFS transporter [Furfurilactobacillus sp. WILCCON 0119]
MKKFSILFVSLLTIMTGAVLSPVLPEIQEAFTKIPTIWIESLVTIPSLLVVLLLPIINRLRISIRKQALIGLLIYGFGGLIPLILSSFAALIISRVLSGIALSMIAGPAISLVTSTYTKNEQQKLLGYASAVTNIGTISSVLFAGLVVAVSWRLTFLVYAFGLISFLLLLFFVPESKPAAIESSKESNSSSISIHLLFFLSLSLTVIYFVLPTNLAFYVLDVLHMTKSLVTAILMASISVFGFFIGLFYKKIPLSMKNKGLIVFFGFALGMLLLSLGNWPSTIIAMPIIGISLGIGMPFLNEWVSLLSNNLNREKNIATSNAMIFAGQFVSPFIFNFLSKMFGLHERGIFALAALISFLQLLVVSMISKRES